MSNWPPREYAGKLCVIGERKDYDGRTCHKDPNSIWYGRDCTCVRLWKKWKEPRFSDLDEVRAEEVWLLFRALPYPIQKRFTQKLVLIHEIDTDES